MAKLAEELKMQAFSSIEQEATLGIIRTADVLAQFTSDVLKPFDLTAPQFNVLRILRGSPGGLSCSEIAERLINRDPDITRLLDRMEYRRLLSRERSLQDRRVVVTRISHAGLELLRRVDPVMLDSNRHQFRGVSEKQLRQLIDLLEKVRESFNQP